MTRRHLLRRRHPCRKQELRERTHNQSRGKFFGAFQPVDRRNAGDDDDGIGRIDIAEVHPALNANHPVRCELVVATDLSTADEAGAFAAAVVDGRHERRARKRDAVCMSAIPSGSEIAAEKTTALAWRGLIRRGRFGISGRRQVCSQNGTSPEYRADRDSCGNESN
jgi:hypothetical protein